MKKELYDKYWGGIEMVGSLTVKALYHLGLTGLVGAIVLKALVHLFRWAIQ